MSLKNGHDSGGDNVTSLDEARRRAAQKARDEKRAAGGARMMSTRDLLIGGLIVVMAIGYIASFFVGTPQVTREGVQ